MTTSRETAATINHSGTSFIKLNVTNTVARSALSAMGSSNAPNSLCQPNRLARKPSAASDRAATANKTRDSVRRWLASAHAMGTTSKIRSTLIMFGIWRTDLAMQLKALDPIFAGGDRLQPPIQRQRALQ